MPAGGFLGVKRPKCERTGGGKPHAATMIVAWSLQSGRLWKYSCDEHVETFGGPSYIAARLEGLVDNHSNRQPVHPINSPYPPAAVLADIARRGDRLTTEELVALLNAPVEGRLGCDADEKPSEDAAPDEKSLGEQLEDDLASALTWEKKQRALAAQAAAEGRPRAINKRRGF